MNNVEYWFIIEFGCSILRKTLCLLHVYNDLKLRPLSVKYGLLAIHQLLPVSM